MRKIILALCTIFLGFSLASCPGAGASPMVSWHTPGGRQLSLSEAVEFLKDYDVVLFGEYHDSTAIHQEQAAFLKEFFKIEPCLALSLEMIEKDTQELLDKYLAGEVSEEYFLEHSRPWPNYRADYAPLANFAKMHRLDVLASNIPRFLANQYAKEGTLANIMPEYQKYLPQVHLAEQDRYFEEFKATMASLQGAEGMSVPEERVWDFYRAQCLKDDVMAQSIFEYRQKQPERKVVHLQGSFHGRYHLGVAAKLKRLQPSLKIAVISPVHLAPGLTHEQLARQQAADGDLLLLVEK